MLLLDEKFIKCNINICDNLNVVCKEISACSVCSYQEQSCMVLLSFKSVAKFIYGYFHWAKSLPVKTHFLNLVRLLEAPMAACQPIIYHCYNKKLNIIENLDFSFTVN